MVYARKLWIVLVFFILLIPFSNSASQEQLEGYALEEALGQKLENEASRVIRTSEEAEKFADEFFAKGRCETKTLIRGGSTKSKYTTRTFGQKFYPAMTCAPDFIICEDKNIQIIDAKRSGSSGGEQISCFDELSNYFNKNKARVERKIICSPTSNKCSVPKGWTKSPSQVGRGALVETSTPIFQIVIFIEVIGWWADKQRGLVFNNCMRNSYDASGAELSFAIPAANPLLKDCFCKTGQAKTDCCSDVIYRDYDVHEFVKEDRMCSRDKEYIYDKCLRNAIYYCKKGNWKDTTGKYLLSNCPVVGINYESPNLNLREVTRHIFECEQYKKEADTNIQVVVARNDDWRTVVEVPQQVDKKQGFTISIRQYQKPQKCAFLIFGCRSAPS